MDSNRHESPKATCTDPSGVQGFRSRCDGPLEHRGHLSPGYTRPSSVRGVHEVTVPTREPGSGTNHPSGVES